MQFLPFRYSPNDEVIKRLWPDLVQPILHYWGAGCYGGSRQREEADFSETFGHPHCASSRRRLLLSLGLQVILPAARLPRAPVWARCRVQCGRPGNGTTPRGDCAVTRSNPGRAGYPFAALPN